ncbi:S-adenosylmethionine mitochondrial carrier protein homolog isoform X2 [Rhodnius prolixus]|uniref:S-adenosylmethionine mitochondrial carrier protein homolog isoform X2 n=1 Tax=Rhodnius prolixus TaxID=13249 RepID=UPI003D187926
MIFSKKKAVPPKKERSIETSFFAGAIAGLVVDVALFPLDTLKTRLQSQYGFWKSGGFKGIYKGVGPTAVGSAPCAAVFFAAYSAFKLKCTPYVNPHEQFVVQMTAATIGETVSCIVKVPTEIVKQRRQACASEGTSVSIFKSILKKDGVNGFYRGFWTTVLRDAPFSVIQFPLWEFFKSEFRQNTGHEVTPAEGALSGAVAGAIAGALTTPLDVVKTRIMLAVGCVKREETSLVPVMKAIYKESGHSPPVAQIGIQFFKSILYEDNIHKLDYHK